MSWFGGLKDVYGGYKMALHSNLAVNALPKAGEAVNFSKYASGGYNAVKDAGKEALDTRIGLMRDSNGKRMFTPNKDGSYSNWDRAKSLAYHRNGKFATGRVAVAGVGAAGAAYGIGNSAYRMASGGGLLKDSDGNTDVMGIPFI